MARKKRIYDDDDGRTIADMSDISRPSMFSNRHSTSFSNKRPNNDKPVEPKIDQQISPAERRMFILGTLKAALLIALAFIVGLGLVTFLLILLWK